jgi:hypothetical protein
MSEMEASNEVFLAKAAAIYDDGYTWIRQFLYLADVSDRTLRRWQDGQRIPGPVRAMILAYEKCRKNGIPMTRNAYA